VRGELAFEARDRVALAPRVDLVLGPVQIAVALRMAAQPVRLAFEQRRPVACACAGDGGARRGDDGGQVVAVDRDARHGVRGRAVRDVGDGHRERDIHRHRVLVVLADEHDGQLPDRRHVERFVERAFVRRPVAEEDHADAIEALRLDAHAHADGDRKTAGDDAVRAEVAAFHVGDVHRAAAAVAIAVFLAEELGEHPRRIGAFGDAMAVAAMRGKNVVVASEFECCADRTRFLPDRQMHRAVDQAAHVACFGGLFELADQLHPRQGDAQRVIAQGGELRTLGRLCGGSAAAGSDSHDQAAAVGAAAPR
jgi:hypothetical protein